MISIITAVRNLLGMNRFFLESLKAHTRNEFELIVVDNGSTDGSMEFFRDRGAKVISNQGNYSYSYCQNQGIREAKFDMLVFLNNDIIVSPNWDEHLIRIMKTENLDIASFASNDRIETPKSTKKLKRRWKRIKYPLIFFLGTSYSNLKLMHKLMYWDWEQWTADRHKKFGDKIMEGFSGSCMVLTKRGLDKMGFWDERILGADFDLYLRSKKRSIEHGDIIPSHILLGVYFHHYTRLTLRSPHYIPYIDQDNFIPLEQKWGKDQIDELFRGIYTIKN
ncbi:MAG: glycosyltransferase [Planctomycetota bacterium]|jgi:GT2 family glycosyltransferase